MPNGGTFRNNAARTPNSRIRTVKSPSTSWTVRTLGWERRASGAESDTASRSYALRSTVQKLSCAVALGRRNGPRAGQLFDAAIGGRVEADANRHRQRRVVDQVGVGPPLVVAGADGHRLRRIGAGGLDEPLARYRRQAAIGFQQVAKRVLLAQGQQRPAVEDLLRVEGRQRVDEALPVVLSGSASTLRTICRNNATGGGSGGQRRNRSRFRLDYA